MDILSPLSIFTPFASTGVVDVVATATPSIGPSGQTIVLRCVDGSGNPTLITAVNPDPTGLAYSLNGGSFVPMTMPAMLYPSPSNSLIVLNAVAYNLPQSAPAFQYGLAGDNAAFLTSGGVPNYQDGTASGRPYSLAGGSAGHIGFLWPRVPAGTFQLAIAWPASGGNSASVPWQITDQDFGILQSGTIDQTVAPSDFTLDGIGYKNIGSPQAIGSPTTGLGILLDSQGATAGNVFLDAGRLARTSSDVSVTFLDTDSVRVQLPANYLTTAAGVVPAGILAATNIVGGSFLGPFDATAKTMPLGYNVEGESPYYSPCAFYSNLARRTGTPFGATWDGDGYPTGFSAPSLGSILIDGRPFGDPGGLGNGMGGIPAGFRTVIWDGASDITGGGGAVVAEQAAYRNLTGTTDNVRVYLAAGSAFQFTPDFSLTIAASGSPVGGVYPVDVGNLRVYYGLGADGVTPLGLTKVGESYVVSNPPPPLFDATVANQIQAAAVLRFMDVRGTNFNWIADDTDFWPETALSRANQPPSHVITSNVASITNVPEDVDPYFCLRHYAVVLVTTSTPHGGANGMTNAAFFNGGTATFTNSAQITFNFFQPSNVRVVNDTQFLMQIAEGGPTGSQSMVAPLGAGGTVTFTRGPTMPLSEQVALCNTYHKAPWVNVSLAQTPSCIAAEAAYWAANLDPGLSVYLETGNEVWNGFLSNNIVAADLSYQYLLAQPGATAWSPSNPDGVDDGQYEYGFVNFMGTACAAWRAAWTAAGRDPADVVRVLGVPGAESNSVGRMLIAQCTAQGVGFEGTATAYYFDGNIPFLAATTANQYAQDTATEGQCQDQCEMVMLGAYALNVLSSYRAELDNAGYTTARMFQYEGSTESLCPTSAGQATLGARLLRHPRAFRLELGRLQGLQDRGFSLATIFYMAREPQSNLGWPTSYAWDQQPGTGNPAVDTANVAAPFDWSQANPPIKSQQLGAHQAWAALVGASSPPPARLRLGENGRTRRWLRSF